MSMAPWAGHKLQSIQKNLSTILAIELIVAGAANALASSAMKAGRGTDLVITLLETYCAYRTGDRPLAYEINSVAQCIQSGLLLKTVSQAIHLE